MKQFNRDSHLYTPFFCEENIWHLTRSLISHCINESDLNILFISNKRKKIALSNQLAGAQEKTVVWDYHVVLLANIEKSCLVFDFDTRLPFPDNIEHYFLHTLPDKINDKYASQFRLIPSSAYLKSFHSDRAHMKNMISGTLFPQYPAILSGHIHKMLLTDLFEIDRIINNTHRFKNINQLLSWVAEQ